MLKNFEQVDWNVVSALASLASTVFVAITLVFLVLQLRSMKRGITAQAFLGVGELVQSEEIRSARARVAKLAAKEFETWTPAEKQDVQTICQSYDFFAQFCRYGFIPTRYVVASWGPSIRFYWPICEKETQEIRKIRKAPETWDDFEWLYLKATKKKYL